MEASGGNFKRRSTRVGVEEENEQGEVVGVAADVAPTTVEETPNVAAVPETSWEDAVLESLASMMGFTTASEDTTAAVDKTSAAATNEESTPGGATPQQGSPARPSWLSGEGSGGHKSKKDE